jgi:putative colanic acid biosysnthesis UDP-glucose lipid carrier transferase
MIALETAVVRGYYYDIARANRVAPPTGSWYVRRGKRIFDLIMSGLVTVLVLSWLFPVVGLLIKLTSRGPVLFRQKRTGRDGREFWCLKFRTMYHRPRAAFAQATRHDPRITPLGRFLRRSNLDEMPQFLNVLLGDMSIVGPRPHPVQLDERYWFTLPDFYVRYRAQPGITGLAQVRGARGETDRIARMKQRVRYDLLYVKRQSFWLDLRLCLETALSMVNWNVNAW